MENRPTDAAQSYLDAMRLGTKRSYGGLMITTKQRGRFLRFTVVTPHAMTTTFIGAT